MKCPKFSVENRGTARRPNYYVRYTVDGVRYREATGARTMLDYNAFVQGLERKFRLGQWTPPVKGQSRGVTFGVYAPQVIAKRVANGVKTAAKDEAAIVRNHLVPEFGDLLLDDLTFQRIVEGFERIRDGGRSGSTVRNIHVVFRAVMRMAAKQGLIAQVPAMLTVKDGELPPVVSVRPEGWRAAAKFTREEIAALVECEEVELQYRVMYVTYFLTGSRFAEVVALRWRSWDRDRVPLGSITLRAVKTARSRGTLYRLAPVHPTLHAWLTWWHREGFELVHGRRPSPDDLIFPTCSKSRQKRGEETCGYNEIYGRWARRHLPAAGLQHRRLHDSRGTFISIIRSAGAHRDVVRSITHRAVEDKVLDEGYTVFEWEAVCAAVGKVDWRLPGPPNSEATVVQLDPRARRRFLRTAAGQFAGDEPRAEVRGPDSGPNPWAAPASSRKD